ncbi:hypothetical protein Tco_0359425 [Tanacetum coccineum]
MLIDELHKFSDGTLNDVRTALDDILKRIRIKRFMCCLGQFVGGETVVGIGFKSHDPPDYGGKSTRDINSSVEVLRLSWTMSYYTTSLASQGSLTRTLVSFLQRITRISIDFLTPRYTLRVLRIILVILPEHSSDTIHSEDGNPVEPTSNKLIVGHSDIENMLEFDESNAYVLERFYTSAGNPIKEILLKLNLHVTGRSSQI